MATTFLPRLWWARDAKWGGEGTLAGTTKAKLPNGQVVTYANARVRLHERKTGELVRETWSGADGAYTFPKLTTNAEFYVVADDVLGNYNAVIANRAKAE